MLKKRERPKVKKFLLEYPPGHGRSFFSDDDDLRDADDAAARLARDLDAVQYG